MSFIAFVPCRIGSERIANKNVRDFAGHKDGLLGIKLRQLAKCEALDEIIVSTNDPKVAEIVMAFSQNDKRFLIDERPDHLGRSSTSMTDFIQYIANLRQTGTCVWTHVTSPFIASSHYNRGILAYQESALKGHDGLVSVTKLQKFLWSKGKPLNYDNRIEKWPRSQDLDPVFEINHAIYMMDFETMRKFGDRIGDRPFFFEMDEVEALDIDWPEQFELLEIIANARPTILGLEIE
jgi:CMP-N-acetylneuraminic acid synthetase